MPPAEFENQAHLKLAACRDGVMLFNPLDSFVGRSLDLYGEYSTGEAAVFDQIVASGDTVLDVGANIGAHALWLARRVGPAGGVVAFEPQRAVFQTLCANMALNGMANVDAYWAAVGSRPGRVIVPRLDPTVAGNFGATSLIWGHPGDQVRLMTIDELELGACRMIKVDVEGMELDALKGAAATISRLRPVLYVENDGRETSAGLIEYIFSMGYRAWWHLPAYFSPENARGVAENVFEQGISVNMVCVHDSVPVTVSGAEPVAGPDDEWTRPARVADSTGVPCWARPAPVINFT
jgi:FkbM family methyltransferase